jgi:hypothetical protein
MVCFSVGQKPSRPKMTRRTKFNTLPWKWHGGQKLSHKNEWADKSPPVKFTRWIKVLPWKWLGGQKPSRKNDWADKSPPVKLTRWTKALPWKCPPCHFWTGVLLSVSWFALHEIVISMDISVNIFLIARIILVENFYKIYCTLSF